VKNWTDFWAHLRRGELNDARQRLPKPEAQLALKEVTATIPHHRHQCRVGGTDLRAVVVDAPGIITIDHRVSAGDREVGRVTGVIIDEGLGQEIGVAEGGIDHAHVVETVATGAIGLEAAIGGEGQEVETMMITAIKTLVVHLFFHEFLKLLFLQKCVFLTN